MRAAVLLVGVTACFSPSTPSGVPCASGPEPRCPAGQVCVQQGGREICLRPDQVRPDDAEIVDALPDAEIDGNPLVDTDGDMVTDDKDNCRTKPNANQYNEDNDNFGDACDPCPISPVNNDSDLDGVGNACDPNPSTPGDTLVLFEGFNAAPQGWTSQGSWTFNGVATVAVAEGQIAYLAAPVVVDARGTAMTALTPMSVGNNGGGIGVALPLGAMGNAGVACVIYIDGDRRVGLYNIGVGEIFQGSDLAWQNNVRYPMRIRRVGEDFTCNVNAATETDNQDVGVNVSSLGVITESVNARIEYLLYVDSP
jgi:hypothetical protein